MKKTQEGSPWESGSAMVRSLRLEQRLNMCSVPRSFLTFGPTHSSPQPREVGTYYPSLTGGRLRTQRGRTNPGPRRWEAQKQGADPGVTGSTSLLYCYHVCVIYSLGGRGVDRGGKSPRLDSDRSPILNAQHPSFLHGHKASSSTSFYHGQALGLLSEKPR